MHAPNRETLMTTLLHENFAIRQFREKSRENELTRKLIDAVILILNHHIDISVVTLVANHCIS